MLSQQEQPVSIIFFKRKAILLASIIAELETICNMPFVVLHISTLSMMAIVLLNY